MLKDRHIALKYSLVRLERLQFMKFCAATTYSFDLKPGNNNKYLIYALSCIYYFLCLDLEK